jgi:two-component system probable response regulator PhcQ
MSHKVLIVDDEPEVIDIMQRFLQMEHYEVRTASSAEEALKILADEPIDVIITDEWMSGMSGTKFLGVVRREYPDSIRILLTGHADLDTAIRAINDGEIYRFFTKPCNFGELTGTLRQAIQQKNLLLETKRLYSAYKQQAAYVKKMESKFPGVTKLDKTETGSIIINENAGDFDSFLGELKAEVNRSEPGSKNKPGKQ